MEPLSRLAEAGRQILAQRHGPKMNDQDRMQQALEANRDYIMSADAWERDGWVQGAGRMAQQQDLERLAGVQADQQREFGRRIVAMDPLGQTREAIARAQAAGEAARQRELDRQAWQAAITTPVGVVPHQPDAVDAYISGVTSPETPVPTGGGNALVRALSPDRLADMAAEQGAREALARSRDRAERSMNTMYGAPAPMVDEAGAVIDPGPYVPAAARNGGWVNTQRGRIAQTQQEALAAMYDPQRYVREVSPYFGIDPMLAEGLYPSDPGDAVANYKADQSLSNILMTGDPSGLSAGQRQMQQDAAGWNVEQDYLDASAARDLYSSPMVSTVSEATDLPLSTVADVAGDPLWGDYESVVQEVSQTMPDATWDDVVTRIEAAGLPAPTGKVQGVLAKYLSALKVPDADAGG